MGLSWLIKFQKTEVFWTQPPVSGGNQKLKETPMNFDELAKATRAAANFREVAEVPEGATQASHL